MRKIHCISMATAVCIISGTMLGGSYQQFDNKLLSSTKKVIDSEKNSKEEDKNLNNNEKNYGEDLGKGDEVLTPKIFNIFEDNKIAQMGSVIKLELPSDDVKPISEYKINSTDVYSSLDESNIDKSLILNNNNENVDEMLGNGKKLLLMNVTIKNVSRDKDIYISDLGLSYLEKNGEISTSKFPPEIKYFSETGYNKDGNWKSYYKFPLEKGESKNVEVGWIIDTNEFDLDNLYICIGSCTSYEYQNFVKLDIVEDKNK